MSSQPLSAFLNQSLKGRTPAEIAIGSALAIVAAQAAFQLLKPGRVLRRLNQLRHRIVRILAAPIVQFKIAEAAKALCFPQKADEAKHVALPEEAYPREKIVALATKLHEDLDSGWDKGQLAGCIYHGAKDHTRLVNEVMEIYQWTNPLHLDIFNAVRKMEAEVVSMVVRMYNGHLEETTGGDGCGALTSGGTESIGMAVKAHRDWGRDVKGITEPNIVMPITAHPAFDKACAYYKIDLIKVPVSPRTGMVDPALVRKHCTSNTVMIVGSSPNFPFGTIDPIDELGKVAVSLNIGLHVDACLGGFVVPFMADAGIPNAPVVDFRVPGVTSISADTHKFGFAPKGTSVVLYRSKKLRSYQYFAIADWPGGLYCSPGASGSKAGNVIAGTWAALLGTGRKGYVDAARAICATAQEMVRGIEKIPTLYVLGTPTASAVSFTSDAIDCYELSEYLTKCPGAWKLNPMQFPAGIQFSLTLVHTRDGIMARFLADVAKGVEHLLEERKKAGEQSGNIGAKGCTVYGSQQSIGDRTILNDVTKSFLDSYYETDQIERKQQLQGAADPERAPALLRPVLKMVASKPKKKG